MFNTFQELCCDVVLYIHFWVNPLFLNVSMFPLSNSASGFPEFLLTANGQHAWTCCIQLLVWHAGGEWQQYGPGDSIGRGQNIPFEKRWEVPFTDNTTCNVAVALHSGLFLSAVVDKVDSGFLPVSLLNISAKSALIVRDWHQNLNVI